MTASDAFDVVFGRYGKSVFDMKEVYGFDLSETLGSCRNACAVEGVYFNFVDNCDFNAVAARFQKQDLMAFFVGIPIILTAFFHTFLSDPSILSSIGRPEKGATGEKPKELLRDLSSIGFLQRLAYSNCEHRQMIARSLASSAIYFIFAHELAHLQLGHLLFLRDNYYSNRLEEIPVDDLSNNDLPLRRALEIDADNGAAFTSLRYWRMNFNMADANVDEAQRDRLWLLSIYLLFSIFSLIGRRTRGHGHSTHPSPGARTGSIMLALWSLKSENPSDERPLSSDLWRDSYIQEAKTWLISQSRDASTAEESIFGMSPEGLIAELSPAFRIINDIAKELDGYRKARLEQLGLPFIDWRKGHTFFDEFSA